MTPTNNTDTIQFNLKREDTIKMLFNPFINETFETRFNISNENNTIPQHIFNIKNGNFTLFNSRPENDYFRNLTSSELMEFVLKKEKLLIEKNTNNIYISKNLQTDALTIPCDYVKNKSITIEKNNNNNANNNSNNSNNNNNNNNNNFDINNDKCIFTIFFISPCINYENSKNKLFRNCYLLGINNNQNSLIMPLKLASPRLYRWREGKDFCVQTIPMMGSIINNLKDNQHNNNNPSPYMLVAFPNNSLMLPTDDRMTTLVAEKLGMPRLFVLNSINNVCCEIRCGPLSSPFPLAKNNHLPATFICMTLLRNNIKFHLIPASNYVFEEIASRKQILESIYHKNEPLVRKIYAMNKNIIQSFNHHSDYYRKWKKNSNTNEYLGCEIESSNNGNVTESWKRLIIIPFSTNLAKKLKEFNIDKCINCHNCLILLITDIGCIYFTSVEKFQEFVRDWNSGNENKLFRGQKLKNWTCSTKCNWLGAILCTPHNSRLMIPTQTYIYDVNDKTNSVLHSFDYTARLLTNYYVAGCTDIIMHCNDLLEYAQVFHATYFHFNCGLHLLTDDAKSCAPSEHVNKIPPEFYEAFNQCRLTFYSNTDSIDSHVVGFNFFKSNFPFITQTKFSPLQYDNQFFADASDLATHLITSGGGGFFENDLDRIMHKLSRRPESWLREVIQRFKSYANAFKGPYNKKRNEYIMCRLLTLPPVFDYVENYSLVVKQRCALIFNEVADTWPIQQNSYDACRRHFMVFEPLVESKWSYKYPFFIYDDYNLDEIANVWSWEETNSNNETHYYGDDRCNGFRTTSYFRPNIFLLASNLTKKSKPCLTLPLVENSSVVSMMQHLLHSSQDSLTPTAIGYGRDVIKQMDFYIRLNHFLTPEFSELKEKRDHLLINVGNYLYLRDLSVSCHEFDDCASTYFDSLMFLLISSFDTREEKRILENIFNISRSDNLNHDNFNASNTCVIKIWLIFILWSRVFSRCDYNTLNTLINRSIPNFVKIWLAKKKSSLTDNLTQFISSLMSLGLICNVNFEVLHHNLQKHKKAITDGGQNYNDMNNTFNKLFMVFNVKHVTEEKDEQCLLRNKKVVEGRVKIKNNVVQEKKEEEEKTEKVEEKKESEEKTEKVEEEEEKTEEKENDDRVENKEKKKVAKNNQSNNYHNDSDHDSHPHPCLKTFVTCLNKIVQLSININQRDRIYTKTILDEATRYLEQQLCKANERCNYKLLNTKIKKNVHVTWMYEYNRLKRLSC